MFGIARKLLINSTVMANYYVMRHSKCSHVLNMLGFLRCYFSCFTRHSEPSGCKPRDHEC